MKQLPSSGLSLTKSIQPGRWGCACGYVVFAWINQRKQYYIKQHGHQFIPLYGCVVESLQVCKAQNWEIKGCSKEQAAKSQGREEGAIKE